MINLSEHMVGRNYHIILNNNTSLKGKCVSYIPAKDNEPEINSLWFETTNGKVVEIYLPAIKQIDRID